MWICAYNPLHVFAQHSNHMSPGLKRFRAEFCNARSLLNEIDWCDTKIKYTPEKAYVTAVFSKLAYLEIPELEVRNHSLAKVIPCLTYQELMARGVPHSVRDPNFLRTMDVNEENIFVVTTNDVVAIGIRMPSVIIVALRGTQSVSDLMTDFHVPTNLTYVNNIGVSFHSGFYLAITGCLDQIAANIQNRIGNGTSTIPVYVVGHSLGGALAAIAHAVDGFKFFSSYQYGRDLTSQLNVHSSYSFGMPRYGDHQAVTSLRSPFHTYNDKDRIPSLPPKTLGYENVPNEYCTVNIGSLIKTYQDWKLLLPWNFPFRYHFIESYIKCLGIAAGHGD